MDKRKPEKQKLQQIFHYDDQNIEEICACLESGMYEDFLECIHF